MIESRCGLLCSECSSHVNAVAAWKQMDIRFMGNALLPHAVRTKDIIIAVSVRKSLASSFMLIHTLIRSMGTILPEQG